MTKHCRYELICKYSPRETRLSVSNTCEDESQAREYCGKYRIHQQEIEEAVSKSLLEQEMDLYKKFIMD